MRFLHRKWKSSSSAVILTLELDQMVSALEHSGLDLSNGHFLYIFYSDI